MSVLDELRKYIREEVAAKRLDQKALAAKLALSQGYVSMILSGQRLGKETATLLEIARHLNLPLSALIAEAERRDLLRHEGTGKQGPHQEGAVDPASARARELEDRIAKLEQERDAYKGLLERVAELTTAFRAEGGTATRPETARSRRHRKAV